MTQTTSQASRRKPPAITVINGNSFVSGLLWQPLNRRQYMKEAREIGATEQMDIVAIRVTRTRRQAGFVSRTAGVGKGMYSLAAALTGLLGDTWLGGFALPDGRYALVAVHGGAIIPGADKILDSLDELEMEIRRFGSSLKFDDEQIFCPSELNFGGKVVDIESILTAKRLDKSFALRPLKFGLSGAELAKFGAGLIVVAALVAGYFAWSAYQDKLAFEAAVQAERIKAAELERINALARQKLVEKALEHPWAKMPLPLDFISACNAELHPLPLSIGGWHSESVRCDLSSFEATYTRAPGTTAKQVAAAAVKWFDNAPGFSDGGNRAIFSNQLLTLLAGDEELMPVSKALAEVYSHFQAISVSAEINEVPYVAPVVETLPGADNTPQEPLPLPNWQKYSVSVETTIPPEILFHGLTSQGIRLTEIIVTRSPTSGITWAVKGEIYAN